MNRLQFTTAFSILMVMDKGKIVFVSAVFSGIAAWPYLSGIDGADLPHTSVNVDQFEKSLVYQSATATMHTTMFMSILRC